MRRRAARSTALCTLASPLDRFVYTAPWIVYTIARLMYFSQSNDLRKRDEKNIEKF